MKTLLIILAIIGGIYVSLLQGNGDQVVSTQHKVEVSNRKIIPMVEAKENETKIEDIIYEIGKVFSKEGNEIVISMINCAYGESRLNPNAVNVNRNGTEDHNLFQVNDVHTKKYGDNFKQSWKENIRVAYEIYKKQGFNAWYSPRCKKI